MERLKKLFKYVFLGGGVRDAFNLARLILLERDSDIVFFSASKVDYQWLEAAYKQCVRSNHRVLLLGPELGVGDTDTYYNISTRLLRFIRCRVLVTASTGLTRQMMPYFCEKIVCIPHSLVSLHMAYPEGTFDPYTDIFCCGEHHREEVVQLNRKDGRKRTPVLVGYSKFDGVEKVAASADSRYHILIAPSWGGGNIIDVFGHELVGQLLDLGYRVTLRPHPAFFYGQNRALDSILKSYKDVEIFTLESSLEEGGALWSADLMISDYSGAAMEFAFCRLKPVLYVDVPLKERNKNWRELDQEPIEIFIREKVGKVVSPSINEIVVGLSSLRENSADLSANIREERSKYWVNFGSFEATVKKEIIALL